MQLAPSSQLAKACPDMLSNKTYGYMAVIRRRQQPSEATVAFADDLDGDEDIRLISIHKYDLPLPYMNYTDRDQLYRRCNAAGCHSSRTLMNHTNTVHSVNNLVTARNNLAYLESHT